jgi:hypothetical protein
MDDARIRELTAEVLKSLRASPETAGRPDLEARVAALEAAVAGLRGGPLPAAAAPARAPEVHVHTHPALRVLNLPGGQGGPCVLEPDKPCVESHACKTLGH